MTWSTKTTPTKGNNMPRTRGRSHGLSKDPAYRIWCQMRQRCRDTNLKNWPDYGGRGIRVCERWENSFQQFIADVGPRPSAAHQIDRFPNNDGNYEPGNCRWATRTEQQRNKRAQKRSEALPTGVYRQRSGRPYAAIGIAGRLTALGTFDTVEEAQAAFLRAKSQYHNTGDTHAAT
jgi:hypothetical protein